uniref:Uncharacterized protein n=1 Tax=Cannabis sativa TaxID=3483 RepID=A0A803QU50_CANSA
MGSSRSLSRFFADRVFWGAFSIFWWKIVEAEKLNFTRRNLIANLDDLRSRIGLGAQHEGFGSHS